MLKISRSSLRAVPLYLLLLAVVFAAVKPVVSYLLIASAVMAQAMLARIWNAGLRVTGHLAALTTLACVLNYMWVLDCDKWLGPRDFVFLILISIFWISYKREEGPLRVHAVVIAPVTIAALMINRGQNENYFGFIAAAPFALSIFSPKLLLRLLGLLAALAIAILNSALGSALSMLAAWFAPRFVLNRPLFLLVVSLPFIWPTAEYMLDGAGYLPVVNAFFQEHFHQNFTSGRALIWSSFVTEQLEENGMFCPGSETFYSTQEKIDLSPHNGYLDAAQKYSYAIFTLVAVLYVWFLNPLRRDIRTVRFLAFLSFLASFETFVVSNNASMASLYALAVGMTLSTSQEKRKKHTNRTSIAPPDLVLTQAQ